MGWGTGMDANYDIVADGFFVFLNCYDMQIYCVGKGPSALTVSAPEAVQTLGTPIVVKGTVTDISAGTEQHVLAKRFPNGVPAMSDASMGEWMEYIYMQKPKPTDATGVEVTVYVLDANGNYREIGKTTSDSNGFYSLMWTPDIPGKYTVYASFAGSESYWPSNAETAFGVVEAPPVETNTDTSTNVSLPPIETYFLGATAAIILAVAIVGFLILKKRA